MRSRTTSWVLLFAMVTWGAIVAPATAQEGIRPGDNRLETPPLQAAEPLPELEFPRPPPLSKEERERLSGGRRGYVERIVVEGSSVFSAADLSAVVAPFENRSLGAEELSRARDAVSKLYHDNGYITSGAVLPDQEVDAGVIVLQVIEGRLVDIEIEGTRSFRESFFHNRLHWAGRQPVSILRIEEALQLLQQHPLIDRVSARLVPGEQLGESRLELVVDEALPARLEIGASNYRSPSVGEYAGELNAGLANILGVADELALDFDITEGLTDVNVSYSVPVNRFDTLVSIHFRDSEGEVVLSDFNSLDIESEARTFGFAIEQPLLRSFGRELRVGLIGELRKSKTKILGKKFCTIAGEATSVPGGSNVIVDAPDCHPRVAALRIFQQYIASGQRSALAARSSFTVGLDTLGATRNSSMVADGQFIAWLGQLQYVYRLPSSLLDSQLVGRLDGQLASDPLLSIEKFAIGGARTVRGYRENQLVRDNGVVASLEVRIPVYRGSRVPLHLFLVPFADVGHGWDESGPAKLETDTVASLGIGLSFKLFDAVRGDLQYGGRLTSAPGENGTGLQRHGLYFRVTIDTLTPWR
jgi:hemolysin activation/secretion protein